MQLHCHALGHGPPLILLHGLYGSSTSWLGIGRSLAAHFTVLAMDLRNHGRSPRSAEMSHDLMAQDLAESLDARDVAAAHVLGHSLGGKAAMQFALTNPARVRRLIVVDIPPRAASPQHLELLSALEGLDLNRCRTREAADAALATQLPDARLRRFLLKNLAPTAERTLRWQIPLADLRANYPRLLEGVSGGRPFAGPTLFLRGEQSDYLGAEDLVGIRRLFPVAMLRTVHGAGHWVHADAPVEFTRLVEEFLLTS